MLLVVIFVSHVDRQLFISLLGGGIMVGSPCTLYWLYGMIATKWQLRMYSFELIFMFFYLQYQRAIFKVLQDRVPEEKASMIITVSDPIIVFLHLQFYFPPILITTRKMTFSVNLC